VGREGYAALEPEDAPPEPHPLMICFWLNVPLLLSATFGAIAVVGLVRDAYALCVIVIGAALLGLLLQASRFAFCVLFCYYARPDVDQAHGHVLFCYYARLTPAAPRSGPSGASGR
jgi:hypothetical protein